MADLGGSKVLKRSRGDHAKHESCSGSAGTALAVPPFADNLPYESMDACGAVSGLVWDEGTRQGLRVRGWPRLAAWDLGAVGAQSRSGSRLIRPLSASRSS
jgi:hypothetical protein